MEPRQAVWALLRLVFVAFLAAFVFYCCLIKWVHMKYDHNPGAPRSRAEEYGPIVHLNAFYKVALLVLSPEGIKVLREVLWLYPPATATLRWTAKENVIEGIKIPANTTLIFCTYVTGRMESFFKDSLVFNPDRFRKDQPRPYFRYFPFSLGPRSCIGQKFAQFNSKILDWANQKDTKMSASF